ncbi:MAG: hypothetical protein ACFE91_17055, partial [Promethearchaeota archaeon]
LFKKFINHKSIHLEKWPLNFKNISIESAEIGKIGIEIIKFLRMLKSKLQISLNQNIGKIILISDKAQLKILKNLKEDIKNTIRIDDLEIIEKSVEKSIKEKPDAIENFEDFNIKVYFFK